MACINQQNLRQHFNQEIYSETLSMMTNSSMLRSAVAVTLLTMTAAVDAVAVTRSRATRMLKGTSYLQQNPVDVLPVSSNGRRRLQPDLDPKTPSTVPEEESPNKTKENGTTDPDATPPGPPKDTKQSSATDKAKKQKEASNFEQLIASNDCQVGSAEPNRIDIECMVAASSEAGGNGGPKDGKGADKKDKNKKSKTNNKLEFSIRTGRDGISISVDYDDTLALDNNKPTQYKIIYDRIIEYQKKGDGSRGWFGGNKNNDASNSTTAELAYEFDADDIVQTLSLDSWKDIEEVSIASSTATGSGSKYYSATTSDGNIVFNFFVKNGAEGQDVISNRVKIDFWVTEFPWRKESDSYIALMSTVNSQQSSLGYKSGKTSKESLVSIDSMANAQSSPTSDGKQEDAKKSKSAYIIFQDYDHEEAAKIGGTEVSQNGSSNDVFFPVGEYAWETTAQMFSQNTISSSNNGGVVSSIESDESTSKDSSSNGISVIATSPSNEDDPTLQIAFSFIGQADSSAKTIYWDPEVGIAYASPDATTLSNNDVFADTSSTGNQQTTSASATPYLINTYLMLVAGFLSFALL